MANTKTQTQKKETVIKVLSFVAGMVLCVWIGYLVGQFINHTTMPWWQLVLLLPLLVVAVYLQVIIHEGGHLLFGLCGGYTFSSFRIASFMWIKQDGKVCFKRYSLAGTGGQCLLKPREGITKTGFILFNLGGVLANLITGLLCVGLFFLPLHPLAQGGFLMMALIGFFYGATNGLPLAVGGVQNDGKNLLECLADAEATRCFQKQMELAAMLAEGKSLTDLSEEWFAVNDESCQKSALCAAIRVFYCSYLLYNGRLEEMAAEAKKLQQEEYNLLGLHRFLLQIDEIYVEQIGDNDTTRIATLQAPPFGDYLKQMKSNLSVARFCYVTAVTEGDEKKIETEKACFEKAVQSHPYPTEVQAERHLVEVAKQKWCATQ